MLSLGSYLDGDSGLRARVLRLARALTLPLLEDRLPGGGAVLAGAGAGVWELGVLTANSIYPPWSGDAVQHLRRIYTAVWGWAAMGGYPALQGLALLRRQVGEQLARVAVVEDGLSKNDSE